MRILYEVKKGRIDENNQLCYLAPAAPALELFLKRGDLITIISTGQVNSGFPRINLEMCIWNTACSEVSQSFNSLQHSFLTFM